MLKYLVFFIFLVIVLSGCAQKRVAPLERNDGLRINAPENVGIDQRLLKSAISEIYQYRENSVSPTLQKNKKYVGITSLLVARKNQLVFERYFNGAALETPVPAASFSKSVLSALIGVAIGEGKIPSVETSLYNYSDYPELQHWDDRKASIQLRHLLTMTTGWDCGSIGDYESHCGAEMDKHADPYKWVLDLPMAAKPGEVFNYNDAVHRFLGAIVAIATDQYATRYYQEKLMLPMQMDNNVLQTSTMTSREMLKFGLLYLNQGRFRDQQIVPESWVKQSTQVQVPFKQPQQLQGYGYLWWVYNFSVGQQSFSGFYAAGNGGQYAFVIPALELVVVFTGINYGSSYYMKQPFEIMEQYILPSIHSS